MKVFKYFIFLTGLSVLLTLSGVETGIGQILNLAGNPLNTPENFESSGFYNQVRLLILSAVVTGIIIGIFTRQSTESIIVASFAVVMLGVATADIISLIIYINGTYQATWLAFLVSAIFIPLLVGYVIALIEWWRGAD